MKQINITLRNIREAANFSQEKTADLMKITQSKYARFERGASKIDLDTLQNFASVFDLKLIDVLTWPKKYVELNSSNNAGNGFKASILIELSQDKKDFILSDLLGKNYAELLNK